MGGAQIFIEMKIFPNSDGLIFFTSSSLPSPPLFKNSTAPQLESATSSKNLTRCCYSHATLAKKGGKKKPLRKEERKYVVLHVFQKCVWKTI